MAKFKEIATIENTESEVVKGAYFRDVSIDKMRELRELGERIEAGEDDDSIEQTVLWYFKNVIVDEDGKPFTDMKKPEDVRGLGVRLMNELTEEVSTRFRSSKND